MIHSKASTRLYLLVLILSAFIAGIGIYGILELRRMNENIRTIYNDRIFPLQQLSAVRFSYSAGILSAAQQAEDRQLDFAGAAKVVNASRTTIDTQWQAYLHTYLTPEESRLAAATEVLMKQASPVIDRLVTVLNNADTAGLDRILHNELGAAVNPVVAKANALVNLQVAIGGQVYRSSTEAYNAAFRKFILLIAVSLLFAMLFSWFQVKSVKGLIRELSDSNRKTKEAEEKWRTYIRYAGDAVLILDEKLQITDVNESACALLGYPREEFMDMNLTVLLAPEEKAALATRMELIRNEGGSLHERTLVRKDGVPVITEVNVRAMESTGFISIIRDITGRRKTELAARQSEEQYRYLFRNSPACIIIWDPEHLGILEVNNEVVEKYGYTREEWMKMNVLDYRPVTDHERIRSFAEQMLAAEYDTVARSTWTHLKKNGEEMQMQISSHRIQYNNRTAVLSLALDITEQLNAENALRRSEEKFRSLVDHAADAIFMVSDNGTIFDVNRSAVELLQYSKKELIGLNVVDLHPPAQRGYLPALWDTLRKNKTHSDERELMRKDGTTVEVDISRRMLPDATGAIAIVRDITERKKAEKALEQSEENLKRAQEIAHVGNWELSVSTSGGIARAGEGLWSDEACRIYGIPPEENRQSFATWLSFVHPDDKEHVLAITGEAEKTLTDASIFHRILLKDGTLKYIYTVGKFRFDEQGNPVGLFGISHDITEIKQAELYREKLLTDLTHRYNELMQFNYIVSHNLRSPLANIIGLTHLFALEKNPVEKEKTIGYIKESATRMDEVIFDLTKILALRTPINEKKEMVLLAGVLNTITDTLRPQIDTSGITITTDIAPEAGRFLSIRAYCESILFNLISNAIKYRSTDRPAELKIAAVKKENDIILTVADNGIGIDLDLHRDRIFGLYSRFNSNTEGKGLGLYMTRLQVESLGGTIEIESTPGEGTVFTITYKSE